MILNVVEPWFSVNEKEPLAYAHVEVVEASDMKPSDLNGYFFIFENYEDFPSASFLLIFKK